MQGSVFCKVGFLQGLFFARSAFCKVGFLQGVSAKVNVAHAL